MNEKQIAALASALDQILHATEALVGFDDDSGITAAVSAAREALAAADAVLP